MATHFGILGWSIPCTEKLGGLQRWDRKESDTTERLTLSLHFKYRQDYYVVIKNNSQECGHEEGWLERKYKGIIRFDGNI